MVYASSEACVSFVILSVHLVLYLAQETKGNALLPMSTKVENHSTK